MISAPAIRAIFKRQWHLCLMAAVVALLYGSVLKDLVLDWVRDPDYGHGFIVPVFAGYALWRSRGRWRNVPLKPSNFGLSVILAAMALLLLGSLGAELFLTRMSLLLLLAGIVLYLFGWKLLGAVAFPLGGGDLPFQALDRVPSGGSQRLFNLAPNRAELLRPDHRRASNTFHSS